MIRETTNSARKTKNRILATPIAVPAIVVKPSSAAIRATTRKVRAQPSIGALLIGVSTAGVFAVLKQRLDGRAVPRIVDNSFANAGDAEARSTAARKTDGKGASAWRCGPRRRR